MATKTKKNLFGITCLAVLAVVTSLMTQTILSSRLQAAGKPKLAPPIISCGTSTKVSIDINVTAGAMGAPAGFSLQWMTLADYVANGNMWYLSGDPRLCKASFSGNASGTRYDLLAGEPVTVRVGDFLLDSGTSTNCATVLLCDTAYVFRSFAHANSTFLRSDFTANLVCSTSPCFEGPACTLSQGYFKTHEEVTIALINANGGFLTLGAVAYDGPQIVSILNQTPAGGNQLVSLAHQVIAVRLSALNDPGVVLLPDYPVAELAFADSLIGSLVVPPVGTGFAKGPAYGSTTLALDTFIGNNHCAPE